MDDFFAELEADIAKSLEMDKLRQDRTAAKKRANTMSLGSASRARAAEEYKELSKILEASEWCSVSTIALFNEQSCDGCGSTHVTFLQYMEVQQMVKKPTTQRWVRVSKPAPENTLPRETLIQPMTTHLCAHCCEDHGFALAVGSRLQRRNEAFVPSITYAQEDINAEAA